MHSQIGSKTTETVLGTRPRRCREANIVLFAPVKGTGPQQWGSQADLCTFCPAGESSCCSLSTSSHCPCSGPHVYLPPPFYPQGLQAGADPGTLPRGCLSDGSQPVWAVEGC